MQSSSGYWDYGHNRYGSSGGAYPEQYPGQYGAAPEHYPGQPYWPEQGQYNPSAPPPPLPSNPNYSHLGSATHHYPYPPGAPSEASAYPSAPTYPPNAPPYPSPHPQPPYGSAPGCFNSPGRPQLSPSPYPSFNSSAYPSLADSYGYPSEPQYPSNPPYHSSSMSQPPGPPLPFPGQQDTPSSQFMYPSSPHTSGSARIDGKPGASPYLQTQGSSSSSGSSGHKLQTSYSWSHGSSDYSQNLNGAGAAGAHTNPGTIVPYSGDVRSWKFCQLYGSLDVWIHSANNLPNLDTFSETLRQGLSTFDVKQALPKLQASLSKRITSDPYVSVILRGATVARTTVIGNNQDPVWEEHFTVHVAHKVAAIQLVVKDNDMVGSQYIGEVKISAESLLSNPIKAQTFDLLNKNGKPCKPGAKLKISLEYCPLHKDPLYKFGVGGPPYRGVPKTYFPLRTGGRLTLYQDAHAPGNLFPPIKLASGQNFEHKCCWEDICQAIVSAQHLIYIAGWSIYTKITLVRDKDKVRDDVFYKTLGELLKWKADKGGVRVLLLVWDDKTSHGVLNNVGVMGTHDEETRKYFRSSAVKCLLAPRYADNKLSWVKQQVVGTLYTHHQKTVVVDAVGPTAKRILTAFVGGLDLCDGRYDTPEHTLFCKLNTVHKDDYHNPNFTTKVESGGPREPWHDLHCKIEGPAAYDVLTNFEQRWRKVAKWHGFQLKAFKPSGWQQDFLIDLHEKASSIQDRHDKEALKVTKENDPESWHIQVFRSIDSGSVKGFPKDAMQAEKENLVGRKNIAIDTSIHTAYIKAIRSAQHFIYIENQYFLGSSFAWPSYKNAGANHLVPIEIALKIVSKIKAREDFVVYIVIPMWPEGDPTGLAVQEILYFQSQTMEMMYTLIAEAIKEEDLEGRRHPTDYLNFFCLGNRELNRGNEPPPSVAPVEGSNQAKAFRNRRFMIYVHSKGMIVDDEYVIIGSANINQRSMDGSRDTEIAMGAYQPYHTWANVRVAPKGEIYGYRMSLWAEHLRRSEQCFMEPWRPECVMKVKSLAQRNWDLYTAPDLRETDGHLLPYPLKVESSGKVVSLPNFECFPDVGGKILGVSTNLPDNLTT